MSERQPIYKSFLLRVWHDNKPGAPWRAMLENVAEPGQRHYFKDMESLAAFILAWEMESTSDGTGDEAKYAGTEPLH